MPNDLSTLFSEDPLNLTKDQIDEAIAYYRAKRAEFELGPKKPKVEPKDHKDLDLDKLDL